MKRVMDTRANIVGGVVDIDSEIPPSFISEHFAVHWTAP